MRILKRLWRGVHQKALDLANWQHKLTLRLTPSLLDVRDGHCFASPTERFTGGVFNPGAIQHGNGILAIAKAQEVHWRLAEGERFMRGPPLLFHFDADLEQVSTREVESTERLPEMERKRFVDFRIFRFRDRYFLNHCSVVPRPVSWDSCESMISELDVESARIRSTRGVDLDFAVNPVEKNWGFFERDGELHLLYSFFPYVLLRAEDWPETRFRTVIRCEKRREFRPWYHRGTLLSLSTNPVPYDDEHFLLLVHSYNRRQSYYRYYQQWAVLLDRHSLLPVKVSRQPVFKGGDCRGYFPGVVFTMATLVMRDRVVFFNGEGDSVCSHVTIERRTLEESFVDL